MNEIKEELGRISNRPISWMGRINLIKMSILPKIIYKFQMMPIEIPQIFLRVMRKLFLKFIWKNKKPRISYHILCKGKTQGGLAAPDIRRYYTAVILARMVDWSKEKCEKRWVQIENRNGNKQLHNDMWIARGYRKWGDDIYGLTKIAFKEWDRIHKQAQWKYNSPLISLSSSKIFAPAGRWSQNKRLIDILKDGLIRTFGDLKMNGWNALTEWRHVQLKHFVSALPTPLRGEKDLTWMEQLCNTQKENQHGITKIYCALAEVGEVNMPPFIERWENELAKKLTLEQKNTILRAAQGLAGDINTREMNYKCLARWYLTPVRLNKITPQEPTTCWRGCGAEGTMTHIWWGCIKIKSYWQEIREIIGKITGIKIEDDPWLCLFHNSNMRRKQYKSSLIPQLLNAAKGTIPKKWKDPSSPTIREWVQRVEYIYNMEELIRRENPMLDASQGKWEMWNK